MLDALLTTSIATGASIVTSGATWLFARKKYVSEVKANDIENMRATLRFYIDLAEDTSKGRLTNSTKYELQITEMVKKADYAYITII
jgi:hypothetical protein